MAITAPQFWLPDIVAKRLTSSAESDKATKFKGTAYKDGQIGLATRKQ